MARAGASSGQDGTAESPPDRAVDAWGTDGPGADLAEPLDVVDVLDLLNLLAAVAGPQLSSIRYPDRPAFQGAKVE